MNNFRIKPGIWLLVGALLLGGVLGACGQKGELYLPDQKTAQKTHS